MSEDRIFLSPPHMGGEEQDFVAEAFASNYVAPCGPMVDAFEAEVSELSGISHTVAVSSGTAAMHLILRHMDVSDRDVVIASSLTFIGGVNPVLYVDAEPWFVDADPDTWNMDVDLLAEAIDTCRKKGKMPAAVISTDIYGQCADYDRIRRVCDPHGIPVISDSAEAMGATYKGRHAGAGTAAAVFSFNGNKIMTTSGGGMVATDDASLAGHVRKLATQARENTVHYEHRETGYNYRMSNISAAIGRGQLRVLDKRLDQKRGIYEYYRDELSRFDGISFMPVASYGIPNHWLACCLFDPQACGVSSDAVHRALEAENIESRPLWKPMHLQPVFRGSPCFGGEVSERLFETGLCLPSGTALTEEQLDRIVSIVRSTMESDCT